MIKALTKLFCHWIHIGKRFVPSQNKKNKTAKYRTQQSSKKSKTFFSHSTCPSFLSK